MRCPLKKFDLPLALRIWILIYIMFFSIAANVNFDLTTLSPSFPYFDKQRNMDEIANRPVSEWVSDKYGSWASKKLAMNTVLECQSF